jgi:hypothetical protein
MKTRPLLVVTILLAGVFSLHAQLPTPTPAVPQDFFINLSATSPTNANRDNGIDLWNLSITIGGVQFGPESGNAVFPFVYAPADYQARDVYTAIQWGSNDNTTLLGEIHAMRLEVIEFRRHMILMGGIFFSFTMLSLLFIRGMM